jgi:hypothetical protein
VKERGILFQGAMVRALLGGTKAQTRRAVKPQPPQHTVAVGNWQDPPGYDPAWWAYTREGPVEHDHPFGGAEIHGEPWRCPYGKVGDRLWVREAFSGPHCMEAGEGFAAVPPSKWGQGSRIWYWADGEPTYGDWTRPRPSIHMPRWACRILLEVTDVRVERLQEISEADAKAEGITEFIGGWWSEHTAEDRAIQAGSTPQEGYRHLWEQINGPGSWDANPWVWAVSFRRLPGASTEQKKGGA